jgi:hypothetical protein
MGHMPSYNPHLQLSAPVSGKQTLGDFYLEHHQICYELMQGWFFLGRERGNRGGRGSEGTSK